MDELDFHLEMLIRRYKEAGLSDEAARAKALARIGDLLYRVTADTLALQSLTVNCLFPTATAAILLVGMISVMLRLDAVLTLLALAVCPALFVVIARLDGRITRAAGKFRESESEVYTVVQRAMSAMRLIQAFAREDDEHWRFMAANC